MARKTKRRNIYGERVKGKVIPVWNPCTQKGFLRVAIVLAIDPETSDVKYMFRTSQLGKDQNGNFVDALYRNVGGHLSEAYGSLRSYVFLYAVDLPHHEDPDKFALALAESLTRRLNDTSQDLWFAPAGVNRGNVPEYKETSDVETG